MRYTSKLVTTAAIVGAAAGIYAYQQINKNSGNSNSSNSSNTSQIPPKTSPTSFNTIETKTVTGYTTTPINTPNGNQPITEFSNPNASNTDTNIKIDMR